MRLTVPIDSKDHMRGHPNAPILLVEYGDYQCPYSRRAHAAVQDLLMRLGDQMGFVYRHFPLTGKHPFAEMAAETAEAAGAQGQFWEMHDELFEFQQQFAPHLIPVLAESLDLDINRLRDDMLARRYREVVEQQAAGGTHTGVEQAPTFFINGEKHEGDTDEASLADAIMRYVA